MLPQNALPLQERWSARREVSFMRRPLLLLPTEESTAPCKA